MAHCLLQLGVQSLSEQIEAVAVSSQQHQQTGASKLDTAVSSLMQQESLQGRLYGRLPGLATVPAAQDGVAVNAVLKELCNLVSRPVQDHRRNRYPKGVCHSIVQSPSWCRALVGANL